MPFGLSSAPHTFTKLMRPVIESLRANKIECVNYLDDFLILGSSKLECLKNVHTTTTLLQSLGFIINREKSVLVPSTRFMFDSIYMIIELPLEKRCRIRKWISILMHRSSCRILFFARFLGLLTSACPAVKYGWLYTKLLERQKFLALQSCNHNYLGTLSLSNEIKSELSWWLQKPIIHQIT